MPTITTKGESLRGLLFLILTLFCISITSSLLKIMIFIYKCQGISVKISKKTKVFKFCANPVAVTNLNKRIYYGLQTGFGVRISAFGLVFPKDGNRS